MGRDRSFVKEEREGEKGIRYKAVGREHEEREGETP